MWDMTPFIPSMYSIAWPRAAIYTTVLNYTRLGRSLGPLGGLITERPNWFSASSAFILLTSTVVTVVTWVYSDHPPQWLPAGSASGSSAGIVFTHVPVLRFFAPQGRHAAPIKVKFGSEEQTAPHCQISPWSAQGWGFTAPKTGKKIRILPI